MPVARGYRLTLPLVAALLCGLLATIAVPARPARSAPVVTLLGTASRNDGSDLTITTAGVAAGHGVIVAVYTENSFSADPGAAICSDSITSPYTPTSRSLVAPTIESRSVPSTTRRPVAVRRSRSLT